MPSFQAGDKVRILSDKQVVQNLQQGHGGWNEKMTTVSLGSYGGYDTSPFFVTQLCQGKVLPSTLQPNTRNVQIIEPKDKFKVRPAEEPKLTI